MDSENWAQTAEWAFLKDLSGRRPAYAAWLRARGHRWRARAIELELQVFQGLPLDAEERAELRAMRRDVDAGWWDHIWRGRSIYLCGDRSPRSPKDAFEFVCPMSWEALEPGASAGVRDCARCNKPVHAVEGVDQARRLADAGQCIAVPASFGDQNVVILGQPKRGWRVEQALRGPRESD